MNIKVWFSYSIISWNGCLLFFYNLIPLLIETAVWNNRMNQTLFLEMKFLLSSASPTKRKKYKIQLLAERNFIFQQPQHFLCFYYFIGVVGIRSADAWCCGIIDSLQWIGWTDPWSIEQHFIEEMLFIREFDAADNVSIERNIDGSRDPSIRSLGTDHAVDQQQHHHLFQTNDAIDSQNKTKEQLSMEWFLLSMKKSYLVEHLLEPLCLFLLFNERFQRSTGSFYSFGNTIRLHHH